DEARAEDSPRPIAADEPRHLFQLGRRHHPPAVTLDRSPAIAPTEPIPEAIPADSADEADQDDEGKPELATLGEIPARREDRLLRDGQAEVPEDHAQEDRAVAPVAEEFGSVKHRAYRTTGLAPVACITPRSRVSLRSGPIFRPLAPESCAC